MLHSIPKLSGLKQSLFHLPSQICEPGIQTRFSNSAPHIFYYFFFILKQLLQKIGQSVHEQLLKNQLLSASTDPLWEKHWILHKIREQVI